MQITDSAYSELLDSCTTDLDNIDAYSPACRTALQNLQFAYNNIERLIEEARSRDTDDSWR